MTWLYNAVGVTQALLVFLIARISHPKQEVSSCFTKTIERKHMKQHFN